MEELKVIDGKVYKEVVTDELDSEIARREDEIRRFENELAKLKTELEEMKVKKVVVDSVVLAEEVKDIIK